MTASAMSRGAPYERKGTLFFKFSIYEISFPGGGSIRPGATALTLMPGANSSAHIGVAFIKTDFERL
jgi:hypothetical protein